MNAGQYYQIDSNNATTLLVFTKKRWLDTYNTLTLVEQHGLRSQGFEGELGNIGFILNNEGNPTKIYIGAGNDEKGTVALANAATLLPSGCYELGESLPRSALVAWSLAQYRFNKYKDRPGLPRILVVPKKELAPIMAESDAIFLIRDLINTPSNDMKPENLADVVEKVANEQGAEFRQWVGEELLQNNFPAIYAVGRAASSPPRLLSFSWGNKNHPCVALVGKGVCFDTGGVNIKPADGMRLMKKDMGGAAQVIGLAQWIMTNRIPIRLHVLIPAVENAISADAYRPGDVLTMRNGLKVEIHNTDAEGRLVLADAIVKACEEKPELLIDFSTLTGAARVAVGPDIAAFFTNSDKMAEDITLAGAATFDPTWRLPLFEGYSDYFKSSIADCSNASAIPYAGAITAALFLQRFIPVGLPWLHFDIMAWNLYSKPGKPEGGEAMGMRAVAYYLRNKYAQ